MRVKMFQHVAQLSGNPVNYMEFKLMTTQFSICFANINFNYTYWHLVGFPYTGAQCRVADILIIRRLIPSAKVITYATKYIL